MLEQAARQLGPVDILVNNAGINRDKSLRKMSAAEWDEVIQCNLNSVFHCTKAALEPMIARGWGRIINIASIIGQTGAFGQANYAAAKAGVIAFTKSVAQEIAKHGITVNAICPGFVDTDMMASMPQAARDAVKNRIPLGRFGDADEVARLVRFLCTEGDWITGAQLNINGGQYM
jgi:NAD(P)-dependent dehydrogenase (short-subunit alcohol dehydrogenase family)